MLKQADNTQLLSCYYHRVRQVRLKRNDERFNPNISCYETTKKTWVLCIVTQARVFMSTFNSHNFDNISEYE